MQNICMNSKVVYIVFGIIFLVFCTSSVFPYPNFVYSNTVLSSDQKKINDKYEDEELNIQSANCEIEVLSFDWFEFMDSYFTKYQTVRVIDIYSQTEYFVQRLGGYNHADVQTIDSQNTEIFKNIYGGEWSWARRPVWVEIDGRFFAGSINGMPHGFSVLDNGEGGHTCIHFLNSKTHGTKRVDEAHQSCVEYAQKNKALLKKYLDKRQQDLVKAVTAR